MTLVIALPCLEGVVVAADRRKHFRDGTYRDDHPKLIKTSWGLVTGYGNGELLDNVAAALFLGRSSSSDVMEDLIASAFWQMGEQAATWVYTRLLEPLPMLAVAVNNGLNPRLVPGHVNLPDLPVAELNDLQRRLTALADRQPAAGELREHILSAASRCRACGAIGSTIDMGVHTAEGSISMNTFNVPPCSQV